MDAYHEAQLVRILEKRRRRGVLGVYDDTPTRPHPHNGDGPAGRPTSPSTLTRQAPPAAVPVPPPPPAHGGAPSSSSMGATTTPTAAKEGLRDWRGGAPQRRPPSTPQRSRPYAEAGYTPARPDYDAAVRYTSPNRVPSLMYSQPRGSTSPPRAGSPAWAAEDVSAPWRSSRRRSFSSVSRPAHLASPWRGGRSVGYDSWEPLSQPPARWRPTTAASPAAVLNATWHSPPRGGTGRLRYSDDGYGHVRRGGVNGEYGSRPRSHHPGRYEGYTEPDRGSRVGRHGTKSRSRSPGGGGGRQKGRGGSQRRSHADEEADQRRRRRQGERAGRKQRDHGGERHHHSHHHHHHDRREGHSWSRYGPLASGVGTLAPLSEGYDTSSVGSRSGDSHSRSRSSSTSSEPHRHRDHGRGRAHKTDRRGKDRRVRDAAARGPAAIPFPRMVGRSQKERVAGSVIPTVGAGAGPGGFPSPRAHGGGTQASAYSASRTNVSQSMHVNPNEQVGLPDVRSTIDLRTSTQVLYAGDWFYKWNRNGTEVHPRWVWVDLQSYLLVWSHRETRDPTFSGSLKLEAISQISPSELVQADEEGLPKTYYVLIIETRQRVLQLATERKNKMNIWFEALTNVVGFVRRRDIARGTEIPD